MSSEMSSEISKMSIFSLNNYDFIRIGGSSNWAILSSDNFRSPDYSRHKIRCLNCHQRGHKMRSCPRPPKPKRCHMCGSEGHLISQCSHKICLYVSIRNGNSWIHVLMRRCLFHSVAEIPRNSHMVAQDAIKNEMRSALYANEKATNKTCAQINGNVITQLYVLLSNNNSSEENNITISFIFRKYRRLSWTVLSIYHRLKRNSVQYVRTKAILQIHVIVLDATSVIYQSVWCKSSIIDPFIRPKSK